MRKALFFVILAALIAGGAALLVLGQTKGKLTRSVKIATLSLAYPSGATAGSVFASFVDAREAAANNPVRAAAAACLPVRVVNGQPRRVADGTTPYYSCLVVLYDPSNRTKACASAGVKLDRSAKVLGAQAKIVSSTVCVNAGL